MKMFTVFAVALFVALAHASSSKQMPISSRLSAEKMASIRQMVDDAGGCNANVCFAIEGSDMIPAPEFEAEKNFVLDVISLIGVEGETEVPNRFAAVQYGSRNSLISSLTDDVGSFALAVDGATQRGGRAFVSGGINFCFSRLFRFRDEPIKIVLLGQGISTIGRSASRRAALFRRFGDICTVSAGTSDEATLIDLAGDPSRVFEVNSFLDVIDLETIVRDIVAGICGIA